MRRVSTRPLLLAIAVACTVTAAPALALGDWPGFRPGHPGGHDRGRPGGHGPTPVASAPEIDAGSGLAAVAAVLAGLAFAWERRRTT